MRDANTPSSREVGLVDIETEDGTITGLSYVADFRAEEEYGVGDLRRTFSRACAPNSFQAHLRSLDGETAGEGLRQADHLHAPANYLALSATGSGLSAIEADQAQRYIAGNLHHTRTRQQLRRYDRMTVPQLRLRAKEAGLSLPSRARKADLIKAVAESELAVRDRVYPAWFHYGKTLVIPRGTEDAYGAKVEQLIDAAHSGMLIVGNLGAGGSFARGMTLVDERDLGPLSRASIEHATLWHIEKMAELEPVIAELRARGHDWHFLGRPRPGTNGEAIYWLNGTTCTLKDGSCAQPFGWFSAASLLAEKFLEPRSR